MSYSMSPCEDAATQEPGEHTWRLRCLQGCSLALQKALDKRVLHRRQEIFSSGKAQPFGPAYTKLPVLEELSSNRESE